MLSYDNNKINNTIIIQNDMSNQELKWAQKSLYNGGKQIADAGMRLRGTKYEKDYEKLWHALSELNSRLINDINK